MGWGFWDPQQALAGHLHGMAGWKVLQPQRSELPLPCFPRGQSMGWPLIEPERSMHVTWLLRVGPLDVNCMPGPLSVPLQTLPPLQPGGN